MSFLRGRVVRLLVVISLFITLLNFYIVPKEEGVSVVKVEVVLVEPPPSPFSLPSSSVSPFSLPSPGNKDEKKEVQGVWKEQLELREKEDQKEKEKKEEN